MARTFTDEEFNTMISELLGEKASFEMLCMIAKKVLQHRIHIWCRADMDLNGRGFEEDILQTVYLVLIKKTVTHFLLRNGPDGEINNDPDGFYNWLITVAQNIRKDFAEDVRVDDHHNKPLPEDDDAPIIVEGPENILDEYENMDLLNRAFDIVLNSKSQVYKIFSWVSMSLLALSLKITKSEAIKLTVKIFSDAELCTMRNTLRTMAKMVPWLKITDSHFAMFDDDLDIEDDDGVSMGECAFSTFFMKKGPKASISDWVNRLNSLVKREIENDTSNS